MVPNTPEPKATALIATNVEIAWLAPDNRGASIVSYDVQIMTFNGTLIQDQLYCKQVVGVSCSIPMYSLSSGIYNLSLGTLIKA